MWDSKSRSFGYSIYWVRIFRTPKLRFTILHSSKLEIFESTVFELSDFQFWDSLSFISLPIRIVWFPRLLMLVSIFGSSDILSPNFEITNFELLNARFTEICLSKIRNSELQTFVFAIYWLRVARNLKLRVSFFQFTIYPNMNLPSLDVSNLQCVELYVGIYEFRNYDFRYFDSRCLLIYEFRNYDSTTLITKFAVLSNSDFATYNFRKLTFWFREWTIIRIQIFEVAIFEIMNLYFPFPDF